MARRSALFEHSEANHLAGTIPNNRDPFRPMSLRKLGLKSKPPNGRLKSKSSDSVHLEAQPGTATDGLHKCKSRNGSRVSLSGPSQRAMRARGSFCWTPMIRKRDAVPYIEALEAWRRDEHDFWDRATREFYWRESEKMLSHRPAFSGARDLAANDSTQRTNRRTSSRSLFVDQSSTLRASEPSSSASVPVQSG